MELFVRATSAENSTKQIGGDWNEIRPKAFRPPARKITGDVNERREAHNKG
jgi:hypothetical protein